MTKSSCMFLTSK